MPSALLKTEVNGVSERGHVRSNSRSSTDEETDSFNLRMRRNYSTYSLHSPDKLISLRQKVLDKIKAGESWFSLEFFPPKTIQGGINLVNRFESMRRGHPLFCDITWHPAGDPAGEKVSSSMKIAETMLNYCGIETMLHMTCCNQTKDDITENLKKAQKVGITNILALRGDPIRGETWKAIENGFNYSTDLVKHIKNMFGDYFTICVAGYPIKHPQATSYEEDLKHLKEKVDAGADFIITQLFFDANDYIKYVADCRKIGVTVPIIPGIMPIESFNSLRIIRSVAFDGKDGGIPRSIEEQLETIKDNEEAIKNFGIDHAVETIKLIRDSGISDGGVHIYTLNREEATKKILRRTGYWLEEEHISRPLPFQIVSTLTRRLQMEQVRPIFWALRPKSYTHRTREWEDYPVGSWSDVVGETDRMYMGSVDHMLFFLKPPEKDGDLLNMWGHSPTCESDIFDVFTSYMAGRQNAAGFKVTRLPWSESIGLNKETVPLLDKLVEVNSKGILTINSQPNICQVPSGDPCFGWGPANGYIYQKAYLEFFCSERLMLRLLDILPSYPIISYHILNWTGTVEHHNYEPGTTNAVTFGIFPGREVIQPTVVGPDVFPVWKDEAFNIWSIYWGELYEEGSQSRELIRSMTSTYFLINLVDNNFPNESLIWEILQKIVD